MGCGASTPAPATDAAPQKPAAAAEKQPQGVVLGATPAASTAKAAAATTAAPAAATAAPAAEEPKKPELSMEEMEELYPGAEGIGSLQQVGDQITMSDLSNMPSIESGTSGSILLGQGSRDTDLTVEEQKSMVDEMHAEMEKIQKEEEMHAKLEAAQDAFSKFDKSGEFQIQMDELGKLLKACDLPLSDEQLESTTKAMFAKFDTDGNGSLTWGEFKKLYMLCLASDRAKKKLVKQALAESTQEIAAAAFKAADADSSGSLDSGELSPLLKKSLGRVAAQMSDEEWTNFVGDVVKRGDKDGNSTFDQEEFLNLFSHCLASPLLVLRYEEKVLKRLEESAPAVQVEATPAA